MAKRRVPHENDMISTANLWDAQLGTLKALDATVEHTFFAGAPGVQNQMVVLGDISIARRGWLNSDEDAVSASEQALSL